MFNLLLIGGPGSGKTRAGLELIDAIDGRGVVTDTERGTQSYREMFKFQYAGGLEHCDSFETTRNLVQDLCHKPVCPDGRDCQLYFLDSVSPLWTDIQAAAEDWNKQKRRRHQFETGLNMGLWGVIKRENKRFIADLRRLSMPIIVTARQVEVWEGPEDNKRLAGYRAEAEKTFEYEFDISLRMIVKDGKYLVQVRKARGIYGEKLGPTGTILESPLVEILYELHDWGKDEVKDTARPTEEQEEEFTLLAKQLELKPAQVSAGFRAHKVARFADLTPDQAEEILVGLRQKREAATNI